ncbi:uncharacterized protein NEMAJ01_1122 [Nematocida major]|uniref:uncharacterized protein n=1 Tax=Nematocida major TaxID=1912982 RepID=UPI0020085E2D|nr:uncharacterized protein NEMAJ01_1122 [Nematocida major]KAH9386226.1 hypothetical protein NEMAJ01_1122 [Nematocida major]
MKRSEMQICTREKGSEKEKNAEGALLPQAAEKPKRRTSIAKKKEAARKEAEEKLKEMEKKRPLKKAIAIKEEERRREEEKKAARKARLKMRALEKKMEKAAGDAVAKAADVISVEKKTKQSAAPRSARAKSIKLTRIGPQEERITKKAKRPEVIEEVLNHPEKKVEIQRMLSELHVEGRKEEIMKISKCLYDPAVHTIYVHGMPGTGKTHVLNKIGVLLGKQRVEVYYCNLLMDNGFKRIGGMGFSTTVVLIVDEFEGEKKDKMFIRQKEKLERQFKRDERKEYKFKVILISNDYNSKGIHFKPYKKEAMDVIIDEKSSAASSPETMVSVHQGVMRRDIRAALAKQIQNSRPGSSETVGLYHQFIKKMVQQGETSVNKIYSDFLQSMKEKGASVMPKEIVRDIIEGYLDGTLL